LGQEKRQNREAPGEENPVPRSKEKKGTEAGPVSGTIRSWEKVQRRRRRRQSIRLVISLWFRILTNLKDRILAIWCNVKDTFLTESFSRL